MRTRYEFVVTGRVSDTIKAAFPDFEVADGPLGGTAIFGPVRDRADLQGMLARLDALGLTLVELRRLPD
ncbi:hypothetical protein [Jiangella asiatica]|uniref:Uncharacterized protein n=1 Tax=Jiangella asiatica TaxID=2530372 RepID=A0A4R5CZR6_9ACTN|nr:hypothetical protein [Jiangella asiatica]TDE03393.1 hypothetical protein E1269_20350 [Jiangella asiatica]